MLGYGNDEFGAGFYEEGNPVGGAEAMGREARNEVFVAKLGVRTVGGKVVTISGAIADVHLAGIPFIAEGRDAVDTPVDENAKLAVEVPIGDGVVLK